MQTETLSKLTYTLTEAIAEELRDLSSEMHAPYRGPDQSDDYIKSKTHNVATLRRIREEIENLAAGIPASHFEGKAK